MIKEHFKNLLRKEKPTVVFFTHTATHKGISYIVAAWRVNNKLYKSQTFYTSSWILKCLEDLNTLSVMRPIRVLSDIADITETTEPDLSSSVESCKSMIDAVWCSVNKQAVQLERMFHQNFSDLKATITLSVTPYMHLTFMVYKGTELYGSFIIKEGSKSEVTFATSEEIYKVAAMFNQEVPALSF